jgi:ribosome-associated heat shock protein Hsp15
MSETEQVRIDKWLWAARFFKTRSLAAAAVSGGKVHVNGQRVKPARPVKTGDDLSIQREPYQFEVRVLAVSERRGPATVARMLYEESEQSRLKREQTAEQMRLERATGVQYGRRPDKRQRRRLRQLQQRNR